MVGRGEVLMATIVNDKPIESGVERFFRRLGQIFCRHQYEFAHEGDYHKFLECARCGARTEGWRSRDEHGHA